MPNGKDKAIAEINNPRSQFVKGDLYVVLDTYDGTHLADGGNPKLVGRNMLEVKDANGKPLMKEMIEVSKTKGSGWVECSWTHPATEKIQKKSTYVKRLEGADKHFHQVRQDKKRVISFFATPSANCRSRIWQIRRVKSSPALFILG
ncbi:MAG: hypothetical protein C0392_13030, partial [Syntrophus sp. (in: bacteria)]|nr:hypothetical protein [Syntrophus sp. (in: bacteria)]